MRGFVTDLNSEGWGVVRSPEGEVAFVPGAWPGDEIDFEIVSRGKFALGKLLSFFKKCEAHRENNCPSREPQSGQCVACPWIGFHYASQITAKNTRIEKLARRSKFAPAEIVPIVASPRERHYRNRVKLHSDGNGVGYRGLLSQAIIKITHCEVVEDWINDEIKLLSKNPPPPGERWIQRGAAGDFAQGNSAQNEKIKALINADVRASPFHSGVELFCGDGNFTECLAPGGSLRAYESSAAAIARLRAKSLASVACETLDLYSGPTLDKIAMQNLQCDFLFLDPPRSGYKELSRLASQLPRLARIVYLSCNPMTFFRDIEELKGTWSFTKLHSFDMFPQTPHIEVMGFFRRNA